VSPSSTINTTTTTTTTTSSSSNSSFSQRILIFVPHADSGLSADDVINYHSHHDEVHSVGSRGDEAIRFQPPLPSQLVPHQSKVYLD
jgi:hypothetical protein